MRDHRRLLLVMLFALVLLSPNHGAFATSTCQGSYAAALLKPLPQHIVIDLDVRNRTPRNLALAQRFLAGARDAGVAVGPRANVLLHITTSHFGGDTSPITPRSMPSSSELAGLQGGQQAQVALPTLPSTGLITGRQPPAAPLLFMRVDATVVGSSGIAWVASIQCQEIGSDDEQRSEDLGRLVGSTLGTRTERRPF